MNFLAFFYIVLYSFSVVCFHERYSLNIAFFILKCLLERLVIHCSELNQDEVCSLKKNENKEDLKHQNRNDLWFIGF